MSNTATILTDAELWDKSWVDRINILANQRKSPLTLSGIFVDIIRGYYSNPDYLPMFACKKWDPDPKKTQVWIDSLARWNIDNPEFRPAILAQTGPITFTTQATKRSGYMGSNTAEGEKYYTHTGNGVVHFIHIASQQAESELLVSATLDYLSGVAWLIAQDYCFDAFNVAQVETSTYTKESKERVRCVLTCSYAFTETWSVKGESLKLKGVVIRTGQNLLDGAIVSP